MLAQAVTVIGFNITVHPCCLPFLKKIVRVASDSSLVKVPDLQPAWMMISITE